VSKIVLLSKPIAPRYELVVFGYQCGEDPVYLCEKGIGKCRRHGQMLNLPDGYVTLAVPVEDAPIGNVAHEKDDVDVA